MTNPEDNALVEAVARAIAPLMAHIFNQANRDMMPYGYVDVADVAELAIATIRQQEANNAGR